MAQDAQMLIRIDTDLKQLVTDIARNEDRSVAWIVRKALHNYVLDRPETKRLERALIDPSAPLPPKYRRPTGRPGKVEAHWLEVWQAKPVLEYLNDQRERVTHDEVFENTSKIALSDASVGHHARLDNIMRAAGWIELVEVHSDGSEQVFWFKNDPRKRN